MIDWQVGGHGNREEREGASARRGRGTDAKDSEGFCTDERLLSVCCQLHPSRYWNVRPLDSNQFIESGQTGELAHHKVAAEPQELGPWLEYILARLTSQPASCIRQSASQAASSQRPSHDRLVAAGKSQQPNYS